VGNTFTLETGEEKEPLNARRYFGWSLKKDETVRRAVASAVSCVWLALVRTVALGQSPLAFAFALRVRTWLWPSCDKLVAVLLEVIERSLLVLDGLPLADLDSVSSIRFGPWSERLDAVERGGLIARASDCVASIERMLVLDW
jgi:hypothetical protein